MSAPVLSQVTSINGLVKGQPWSYQPAITSGGPVALWAASGLPPGITLNTTTGKLSGVPTTPGVFNVTLSARDATPLWNVTPLVFPMGVESIPFEADGAIRIDVNLQTGEVYLVDSAKPLYVKAGDKLLVSVGFKDDENYQDIPMMTLINFAMKVWDDEEHIPINDGLFTKVGDYDTTRYVTTLDLTAPRIREAFDEFEDRYGTGFVAECEINWIWFVWRAGIDTPQRHERTSQHFKMDTWRDLDPTVRAPEPNI